MPRKYERKTTRGASNDVLLRATKEVEEGWTVRSAAKAHNVDRMTLHRFISHQKKMQQIETPDEDVSFGYKRIASSHKIFSCKMENDLALHLTALADMFYGLPQQRCRELAYEFAISNDVVVPKSWHSNRTAGREWFVGFKERHNLSLRLPEGTSVPRATAFNESIVSEFYDNIATAMDKNKLKPHDLYNADQISVSTVQVPKDRTAQIGRKHKASMTSAEQGELITIVCTINSVGNSVPPLFILPEVSFNEHFLMGAPVGSAGCVALSGLIDENIFREKFIPHLVEHTRCTKERPILLILKNHDSYVSIRTAQVAKDNGIVMVAFPPHTSRLLQPLDRSVFGPFKCHYNSAIDEWTQLNPGKTVTINDVPALVNVALQHTMTPRNILAGFQSTGIYPVNKDLIKKNTTFLLQKGLDQLISMDAPQALNPSSNYPVQSHFESDVDSSGETKTQSKLLPLGSYSEGLSTSEPYYVSRNNDDISRRLSMSTQGDLHDSKGKYVTPTTTTYPSKSGARKITARKTIRGPRNMGEKQMAQRRKITQGVNESEREQMKEKVDHAKGIPHSKDM